MLMEIIKTILVEVISGILHVFYLFPINRKKVLFFPENGHYYCNLKAIDQYFKMNDEKIQIIWCSKDKKDQSYPVGVNVCLFPSISFFYHYFTASVIVFNSVLPSWVYKRRGQIFINTWHGGGAYKKTDAVFINAPKWHKYRLYRNFGKIDYVISACKKFTNAFRADTGIEAEFLPIGMPRNDIFFSGKRSEDAKTLVKDYYHVSKGTRIVMYAPTFRNKAIKFDLNVNDLLQALKKRFHGKFILFVRSHPHVAKDIFDGTTSRSDIVDVSNYWDMQELLCAADVLITDYSSSIWDFSLTGKPCFIYANDLETYKNERDFHTPIIDWPFPLATNNEKLLENIDDFDEQYYAKKIKYHQRDLGSYENGHATELVCQLIMNYLRK